jgi:3D-(3,5/4)-trihydroxycyclohexane-1,2-dione acylhydrolase (decyclizing)
LGEFAAALEKARSSDKTAVIVTKVRAKDFTEGGAFWQVGVPEESPRTAVVEARASMDRGLKAQRKGV